ncbi:RNA polymerase II-associated protein 1-like [Penaeus indicus]|uniref:RNA polymerase II-associated protein 1-like n=1 Tax=Penaeus indicus TaxID=29960 RepID=UPI00300C63C9
MIQRPKRGETDEDLLRQEEEFLARANSRPAATVVSVNKRKTDEEDEKKTESQKPQSKFARERANKKKREGIVDNTVLKEAASREERVAVLGRIVERVVPPNVSLEDWKPEANPHGFPKAHQLSNLKHGAPSSDTNLLTGSRKKSLYMQELQEKGAIKKQGNQEAAATLSARPVVPSSDVKDPRISALGQQSYIIQGDVSEAQKIHNENISKIASMSHDERLKAQQELMASLGPKELNFLQSLRMKKEMLKCQQTEDELMDCEASEKEDQSHLHLPRLQVVQTRERNYGK